MIPGGLEVGPIWIKSAAGAGIPRIDGVTNKHKPGTKISVIDSSTCGTVKLNHILSATAD